MKLKIIFILGIFFLFDGIFSQATNLSKLTIQINGIKNKKGTVNVAIYKSDDDFQKEKFSYVSRIPADAMVTFVFDKVDYGKYAVAVYHDENENKKLDRNFLGMPKEGYGFSNNVKGKLGPPEFKDTSFTMTQPETNLSIQLIY